MSGFLRCAPCACFVGFGFAIFLTGQSFAESPQPHQLATGLPAPALSHRPSAEQLRPLAPHHPLASVLKYAREEQSYLAQTVRDFTCRLIKRERIDGVLQDYQYIDMKVREEQRSGNRVVQPLSIFLKFLAPQEFVGRKVVYVAGKNDGKMLVRKGGTRFEYVVVEIDPDGESARNQSLVPITQSGFNHVLSRMVGILEAHAEADPTGQNTVVERVRGAKINARLCSVIRIKHPKKQPGLQFHIANVFVDDELRVPVRIDFCQWPKTPNDPPPLSAEFTYTNLRLNVNLTDAAFDPALVRAKR